MKKIFLLFMFVSILCACDEDDDQNSNTELIGDWKLIESLADPGDGSGIFVSVDSDKIISFQDDGTVTSNGDLCINSISSDNQTSGIYSNSEFTIESANCNDPFFKVTFEQNGNILIISYPCFEACNAKYVKQ